LNHQKDSGAPCFIAKRGVFWSSGLISRVQQFVFSDERLFICRLSFGKSGILTKRSPRARLIQTAATFCACRRSWLFYFRRSLIYVKERETRALLIRKWTIGKKKDLLAMGKQCASAVKKSPDFDLQPNTRAYNLFVRRIFFSACLFDVCFLSLCKSAWCLYLAVYLKPEKSCRLHNAAYFRR